MNQPKGKKPAGTHLARIVEEAEKEERQQARQTERLKGTAEMADLITAAEEMRAEKDEADRLEAEAKQHKDRYDELRKQIIPDLMKRLKLLDSKGKGSFTFEAGKVHLETKIYANCTEENRPTFHAWLKKEGATDLIKEVVNPQTLSAFVRERRAEGLTDPPLVAVHEETVAKLTKR